MNLKMMKEYVIKNLSRIISGKAIMPYHSKGLQPVIQERKTLVLS